MSDDCLVNLKTEPYISALCTETWKKPIDWSLGLTQKISQSGGVYSTLDLVHAVYFWGFKLSGVLDICKICGQNMLPISIKQQTQTTYAKIREHLIQINVKFWRKSSV